MERRTQHSLVSEWLWLSILSLVVFGIGLTFTAATTITLLQTRVAGAYARAHYEPEHAHRDGRAAIGRFSAGALITAIGAPVTVLLSATAVGAYGAFVYFARPAVRLASSDLAPTNAPVRGEGTS